MGDVVDVPSIATDWPRIRSWSFASDNGARWTPEEISQFGHRSNLDNRGQKSDVYDGGHRIPFIVRWPGHVRAGSTSDELGCLVDLMATCAGVAGVSLPHDAAEDSFDLRPALLEEHGQTNPRCRRASLGLRHVCDSLGRLEAGRGLWAPAVSPARYAFSRSPASPTCSSTI